MVVASDPMYQPTETEASPRVRTAFSEVRQRQLPDIARTRYASAKAAFDRKDYQSAEQQFRELLRLIDDPDMGGRLGDLRLLVNGFVDLSAAAAAPPRPSRSRSRGAKRRPPAPVAPTAPDPQRVSRWTTTAWRCRTPIRQDVPRVPVQIANQTRDRGILEVVIDEQGRVIRRDDPRRAAPDLRRADSRRRAGMAVPAGPRERPACEIP